MSTSLLSQEKLLKKSQVFTKEITIIADELDDIVIENIEGNKIEVILLDENPNTHHVFIEEENNTLKVGFKLEFDVYEEPVFRKYITKRLQRANAIVKIPKNKEVTVYGKTIDVVSKNYDGDIKVFIDKGNVKLHEVQRNATVALFLGNVSAKLKNKCAINIKTNKGEIVVNDTIFKEKSSINTAKKTSCNFTVKSMNANVNLITK
ncbi:hypothetical protein [Tenacibaculum soleae]|uniref:hypothetical protein n=1 Tax=Tenacibaculum soleae TaxID=447689 RepID=UPI003AB2397A